MGEPPRAGDGLADAAVLQELPQQRPEQRATDATRYLCVGAQIDSIFGRGVLRETLEQRHRAIAPSYGFDVVPVVVHALSARRRRTQRDTALTLLSALNLIVNPALTITTALSWLWVRFVYRSTRRRRPRSHPGYALSAAVVAYIVFIPILALMGWMLILLLRAISPLGTNPVLFLVGPLGVIFGPLGALFRMNGPAAGPFLFVLSLAAAWAIVAWEHLRMRDLLVRELRRDGFNPTSPPNTNPRVGHRLQDIERSEKQNNVTVYGGYFPFLGAGYKDRTWSFTVDLSRGSDGPDGKPQRPEPFAISALHRFVEERVDNLRSVKVDRAQRLAGMTMEDRIFASGRAVHGDQRFLSRPGLPPQSWLRPEAVQQIIDNPTGAVRHFKCIRVESWSSEVVQSVFLHFTIDGKTLYVEQTACVLPPIKAEYHVVDRLAQGFLPGERMEVLLQTLKAVPASLLRAPVELVTSLWQEQQEYKQRRILWATVNQNIPINYGARVSIRELATDPDFHNYFQDLDSYRHVQIIELQVLNAILDFLEKKRVDTAEFRARQAAILNNGIFMPGGTITDSTVAGGPLSTATSTPRRPAGRGPEASQSRKD